MPPAPRTCRERTRDEQSRDAMSIIVIAPLSSQTPNPNPTPAPPTQNRSKSHPSVDRGRRTRLANFKHAPPRRCVRRRRPRPNWPGGQRLQHGPPPCGLWVLPLAQARAAVASCAGGGSVVSCHGPVAPWLPVPDLDRSIDSHTSPHSINSLGPMPPTKQAAPGRFGTHPVHTRTRARSPHGASAVAVAVAVVNERS